MSLRIEETKSKKETDLTQDLKSVSHAHFSNESVFFEDERESPRLLLEESKSRLSFLSRIAIIFSCYYCFLLLGCWLLMLNNAKVKWLINGDRFRKSELSLLLLTFMFKMTFLIAGTRLRFHSKVLFAIDTVLSAICIFALQLLFDPSFSLENKYSPDMTTVILTNLLLSSLMFGLTTMADPSEMNYDCRLSFGVMFVANMACLVAFFCIWKGEIMSWARLVILSVGFLIYDAFFSVNAYFILNYRTKKFYADEPIYCYFCFWSDWLGVFWLDAVNHSNFMRDKRKKQANEAKRKKAKLNTIKKIQASKDKMKEMSEEKVKADT